MNAIKKVLIMLLFLCCSVTVFCYIGFRLGYDGLLIIGEVVLPEWLMIIITYTIFVLQLTMMGAFSINEYTYRIWKYMAPMLIVSIILFEVLPERYTFFASGVLPFGYYFVFGICKKHVKQTSIRVGICLGLLVGYQILTLFFKIGSFKLGYNILTDYEWFVWSIDLMLFIFVIYALGGERYYEKAKYFICSEDIELDQYDSDDRKSIEQLQKLSKFKKLAAMSLLIGFQVLQWAIILIVCYLDNIFLEGLIITTSFVTTGFIIKRRWHSNSLIVCTLSSVVMFYISAKITISFAYSQFFSIFIGAALIYGLYRLSIAIDKEEIESNEVSIQRLKEIERKMDDAWSTIDKISNTL